MRLQRTTDHGPRTRRAFTLTEMLVVIGIIVLILALAVPAFNFITGARSLEAAQNSVSAMLARARSQAIYTGKAVGVAFYIDQVSDRYVMGMVVDSDPTTTVCELELATDQDPQPLQPGVGIQGVIGWGLYSGVQNNSPAIIMFDGQGRLVMDDYSIAKTSEFGKKAGLPSNLGFPPTPLSTQLALISYDRNAFDNQASPATWLNDNGLMLVINRYNGTLLGTE